MFNNSNEIQIEVDENVKIRFFECILNDNLPEIIEFFRNESYEAWTFKEHEDYTALHRAAFLNLTRVVITILTEMRVRLGPSAKKVITRFVNEKSSQGYTALHYASYRGNIEIVDKLLESGGEVEVTNHRGLNVLHMAAQGNQPSTLVYFKDKYLLNIHCIDEMGSTPLHWACYTGSEIAVLFLLSWYSNVNIKDKEGLTPLHLAVMSERSRIIKKLLQKGADRTLQDSNGRSAYDLAVAKSKTAIMELLKISPSCQMCLFKLPNQKAEKSSFNIVFFLLLHLTVSFAVFCALLPIINLYTFGIIFLILLFLVIISYVLLIFVDPGLIRNGEDKTFLTLIEEKVNINNYCPHCIVKKAPLSKHCIFCDKCIARFDHHCYWVNNCIGKNNVWLFRGFLFFTLLNILYLMSICVLCIANDDPSPEMTDTRFPPLLTFWPDLYTRSSKTIISASVLIICAIFAFPLICLILLQIKNCISRMKRKFHGITRTSKLRTALGDTLDSANEKERSLISEKSIQKNQQNSSCEIQKEKGKKTVYKY